MLLFILFGILINILLGIILYSNTRRYAISQFIKVIHVNKNVKICQSSENLHLNMKVVKLPILTHSKHQKLIKHNFANEDLKTVKITAQILFF